MNGYQSQFRWKNLNLNMELHVAGDFIYEGISIIDRITQLRYEDEYFQFLYNISVGIERLEKIAYLLVADLSGEECPSTKWQKHDHLKLYRLINKHIDFSYGTRERDFLNVLRSFYIEGRYDRFNYSTKEHSINKDKDLLLSFLEKHLNLRPQNILGDERILYLTSKIKDAIGDVVGSIVLPLYDLICQTASDLHLYTYEIRYESKAFKIFTEKSFSFRKERTAQREIIINLIHRKWNSNKIINAIQSINPIDIEELSMDRYLSFLMNNNVCTDVRDEVFQVYEDDNLNNRAAQIEFIGNECDYEDEEE